MSDRYAVFGNPIEHSKSPDIHRMFAEQTGEDIEYHRELVSLDKFPDAVAEFFQAGGKGLNITVPFKLEAYNLAHSLTERAQLAGAVNTLWQDQNGHLCADTTDGLGLVNDLIGNHGWELTGKRILMLGAGGAVRGVLQPILAQTPKQLIIANRTAAKAVDLAKQFSSFGNITGSGFEDVTGEFDIIINGTSASIGGELPPIPSEVIQKDSCCYDMMYGAKPTVFLQWAEQNGCRYLADGLGMLVGQAAESFFIWRGVRPDVHPVIENIRLKLS